MKRFLLSPAIFVPIFLGSFWVYVIYCPIFCTEINFIPTIQLGLTHPVFERSFQPKSTPPKQRFAQHSPPGRGVLTGEAVGRGGFNRYEYKRNLMGSEFNLIFYAPNDSVAKTASDSVFVRINYLNTVLSDYLDNSETNRLSASAGSGQWFYASPVLFDVLQESVEISQRTNGTFDCTVGPIVQLWRRALRRNYFPDKDQIALALRGVGHRWVELDKKEQRIRLRRSNMRLDFGGIGKGYAADEALRVLQHFGLKQALLDAGGDLAVGSAPPNSKGWAIVVSSGGADSTDQQTLFLQNCGVATSGVAYRFLEHQGQKYSHIVDPRTGVGLRTHVRTTVIAPNGTFADALATAFSVLGVKNGQKIAKKWPNVGVWSIENNGAQSQRWKSSHFDLLFSEGSQ